MEKREKTLKYRLKVDYCEGDCRKCNHFLYEPKDDEILKVVKKKVTRHYIPPDLTALKMLTSEKHDDDYIKLSDAELDELLQKLLKESL